MNKYYMPMLRDPMIPWQELVNFYYSLLKERLPSVYSRDLLQQHFDPSDILLRQRGLWCDARGNGARSPS